MMDDYDVKLISNFAIGGYDLYITRKRGDGRIEFIQLPDPVLCVTVDPMTAEAERIRPTLTISEHTANRMAQALADKDIKTDRDAKLQGTIEAMREHLADLRKMLKLDRGITNAD